MKINFLYISLENSLATDIEYSELRQFFETLPLVRNVPWNLSVGQKSSIHGRYSQR